MLVIVGTGLALYGCGGSTRTVTVTGPSGSASPSATAPTSTSAPSSSGPPDCSTINAHTFVGKCTTSGVIYTFANPGAAVRLPTMTVKFLSVRVASSISGTYQSAHANGKFVIAAISVTNRDTNPDTFQEYPSLTQAELHIGNDNYAPSLAAENQADPRSFMTNNTNGPIQPGETRVGDVDFDVPPSAAAMATTHGGLLVADFGKAIDASSAIAALKFFTP